MMDKLEEGAHSEAQAKILDSLESKVVDLQSQLRTVRQQIEKGVESSGSTTAAAAPPSSFYPPAAGRGYQGRGGGRYGAPGRGGYGGRVTAYQYGTGGGRGRGRFASSSYRREDAGGEAAAHEETETADNSVTIAGESG